MRTEKYKQKEKNTEKHCREKVFWRGYSLTTFVIEKVLVVISVNGIIIVEDDLFYFLKRKLTKSNNFYQKR